MKQNSLISKSYKRKDTFVGTEIITLVREFILELKLSSFSIDRRKRNIKNDKKKILVESRAIENVHCLQHTAWPKL